MLDREGREIVFHCDTCPGLFESEETEFNDAWALAKRQGWRAYKVEGEWCHSCPDCER